MYKVILPIRFLLKRPISYLAVLAVGLCVFMVVVVMTVTAAMVENFKERNHNFVGDCVVGTESMVGFGYYDDFERILADEDFVEATTSVIKSYGLITQAEKDWKTGATIMGIDLEGYGKVTGFFDSLYYHKSEPMKAFEPVYDVNLPGCVMGINMVLGRAVDGKYKHSKVPEKMGFEISCFPLTPKGALARAGAGLVNTKKFYYSDDSHTKLFEANRTVYLPFEEAQKLCGMATGPMRANAIHIKFRPGIELEVGCEKVRSLWAKFVENKSAAKQANLLSNVQVQSWKNYRRAIMAAMDAQQMVMSIVFGLIGIVVVFVVFVVFYMIVSHKSKDIGILKSVGVSNWNVMSLFLGFGFLVGVFGSVVGAVCGLVLLEKFGLVEKWLVKYFDSHLMETVIEVVDDIGDELKLKVVIVTILSGIVVSLAGALVPSVQASRREPIENLQVTQL